MMSRACAPAVDLASLPPPRQLAYASREDSPHLSVVPGGCCHRTDMTSQELAGHRDLSTTQRYMHVSPAAVENAIRLLDSTVPLALRGDGVRDRVENPVTKGGIW